ncbi:hypothetical protein AAZX31_09G229000 [Glycine max]
MGDNVTVSTTQHHIAIPIEKLNASLEAAKEENSVTDDAYVDNDVQKSQEKDEETEEKGECRYCQEEDLVSNMESPCNCNGSVKYVHRRCIDQWYNSKGRMILCEICRKPYNPNDYPPLPELHSDNDDTEIIILREEWTIPGTNTQIRSPLVLADRATKGLIDSMNKDFSLRNPTGGVIFGMSLVIFIAVLLIKDAYEFAPPKEEKFAHFLYSAVMTISVLVYILSWVLQCQAYRKSERERERERQRDRNA